jgi:hypothetical protein
MGAKYYKTETSRRNAKRVTLRVGVEVSGKDEHGRRFVVRTETRNVSRDGGCLALDRDVVNGDRLKLTNSRGTQFIIRVHWCLYDGQKNLRMIGFKLSEKSRGWILSDGSTIRREPMSGRSLGAYAVSSGALNSTPVANAPGCEPEIPPAQRQPKASSGAPSFFTQMAGLLWMPIYLFFSRPFSSFRTD